MPELKTNLQYATSKYLKELYENLDELKDIVQLIDNAIVEDPPISVKEGGIIKRGYSEEIDSYKAASTEGKNWIVALEARERELTRN
jgi:DNA mismatch repair protein MutS